MKIFVELTVEQSNADNLKLGSLCYDTIINDNLNSRWIDRKIFPVLTEKNLEIVKPRSISYMVITNIREISRDFTTSDLKVDIQEDLREYSPGDDDLPF